MSGNLAWGALSGIGLEDAYLTPAGAMNSKHVSIMKIHTSRNKGLNGKLLGIFQFPTTLCPYSDAR